MKYRPRRKLSEAERAAQFEAAVAAGVDDPVLAAVWPFDPRRKKNPKPAPTPTPEKPPEIGREMQCIFAFERLLVSLQERDLASLREFQRQLLEVYGLRVEPDDFESRWPAHPDERERS